MKRFDNLALIGQGARLDQLPALLCSKGNERCATAAGSPAEGVPGAAFVMQTGGEDLPYRVSCDQGHESALTATELEKLVASGEYGCERCGRPRELVQHSLRDEGFHLECVVCSNPLYADTLEAALQEMEMGCPHCREHGFQFDSVHVNDSWQYWSASYEWMRSGKDDSSLTRKGRSDYWEGLVHFCHLEEFISIYRDSVIRASGTGYFRVPAVCLTEATAGNWRELQQVHGASGYVFAKKQVLANRGGPALYLPETNLREQLAQGGFAPSVQPFVNLIRIPSVDPSKRKHDYLHEREWRMPDNVDLRKIEPFAAIIDWSQVNVSVPGWQNVFGAAMNYEELNAG